MLVLWTPFSSTEGCHCHLPSSVTPAHGFLLLGKHQNLATACMAAAGPGGSPYLVFHSASSADLESTAIPPDLGRLSRLFRLAGIPSFPYLSPDLSALISSFRSLFCFRDLSQAPPVLTDPFSPIPSSVFNYIFMLVII